MKNERLRSVRVTPENETLFYDFIKNNFAEYFFFNADYAQYPESTEIHMALDNEEKIQGLVLNWKSRRIHLRGSIRSLEFLLDKEKLKPRSVTGFENHKELIAKLFPECKEVKELYRMWLKKGDQEDFEKYTFQILSESHREEITSLMRIADPTYWGSREAEDILIDENNTWYGIIKEKDLICVTCIWKYENVALFVIVGTHPDYWNQGYASSLISSTLKVLFREKEQCFIMVRVSNAPAVHTYKKIGFLICNTHYSYERS